MDRLETAFYLRTFMLDLQEGALPNRRFAASVLREYADVRTLRTLIGALADGDEEVRLLACEGVETILKSTAIGEFIPSSVAQEAMQQLGHIYLKRPDSLTLRPIAVAISSPDAVVSLATREMLQNFPCMDLAQLAQLEGDDATSIQTAAWNALRWQYERSQRATVDLCVEIALGKTCERLLPAVRSLIASLPDPLCIVDSAILFDMVSSNDSLLIDAGWVALNALFSKGQNEGLYESAFQWVRNHFEEWVRLCARQEDVAPQAIPANAQLPTNDVVPEVVTPNAQHPTPNAQIPNNDMASEVITALTRSDCFLRNWRGLGAAKLRRWAAVTHPSQRMAREAWNLLVFNFTPDDHYGSATAVVIVELAVGLLEGDREAAREFMLAHPHCLQSSQEYALWHLSKEGEWGTRLLVRLLSHERKEIQQDAFKELFPLHIPDDLLPAFLAYAGQTSNVGQLIARYGKDICWDVFSKQFAQHRQPALFRGLIGIDERSSLRLLFDQIASSAGAPRQEACHLLCSECHRFQDQQSKIHIDGALLILESCDPEMTILDSAKQWHQEFLNTGIKEWQQDLLFRPDGDVPVELMCRCVLVTEYGTDSQKVQTLNKILADNPRTNASLLKRCAEWKKRETLTAPVQRLENYLMGPRAAGYTPTAANELLQGSEAPTEPQPERPTGIFRLFK